MCRSIKRLYNTESAVTEEELHEAALQFVRKISGFRKPSRANEAAFNAAVEEITGASARLLAALQSPKASQKPANAEERCLSLGHSELRPGDSLLN